MDAIVGETSRLILRRLGPADGEALAPVLGDAEVMRFSVYGAESPDGIRGFLKATQRRYERDGVGPWAVVLRETGRCAGICGISRQLVEGQLEYELGYRLARPYWGQGIATEAAIACRDVGFGPKDLARLISIVEAANLPSIRVAEKVGMRPEKDGAFYGVPVKIFSLERGSASGREQH